MPSGNSAPAAVPVVTLNLEAPVADAQNHSQDLIPVLYVNAANGTSTVSDYNPVGSLNGLNVTSVVATYSGQNGTGYITAVDDETQSESSGASASAITSFFGPGDAFGETVVYSQANGQGTPLQVNAFHQPSLQSQAQGQLQKQEQIHAQAAPSPAASSAAPSQTFAQVAASLGMAGVTGSVLAAMNDLAAAPAVTTKASGASYATYSAGGFDSLVPQRGSVAVPLASTGPQAVLVEGVDDNGNTVLMPNDHFTMPAVPAAEQAATGIAEILNVDAQTATFLAVSAGSDASGTLYVVDRNDDLLEEVANGAGGGGADTNTQFPASGDYAGDHFPNMPGFLLYADGTALVAVADFAGATTSTGAAIAPASEGAIVDGWVLAGTNPATPAAYALTGGAQTARNVQVAAINSADALPDYGYTISVAADSATGGDATIAGAAASGYTGTATLSGVPEVELDGTPYDLFVVPTAGGAPVHSGDEDANAVGVIVAEGANAAASAIDLDYNVPAYLHLDTQGDRIGLDTIGNELYLPGTRAAYTLSYDAADGALDVYKGAAASGTATAITVGGDSLSSGELNFTDGTRAGLGDTGDAVEYLGTDSTATLDDDGAQTLYGGPSANDNLHEHQRAA